MQSLLIQLILSLIEIGHMKDKVFLDSNIILYSYSNTELDKNLIANVILEIDNNFKIVNFSLTTQMKSIKIKEKYNLQYYDSLILATALENGCDILYSEDMQHGQIIENQIKIINPFQPCRENQE